MIKDATLNDVIKALDRNQSTLDDLLSWIKVSTAQKVKEVLCSTFDTPQKIAIYNLSNGNTITEIQEKSGISDSQISRYHKKWHNLGLMREIFASGRGYRHIKVFNLEDFDIQIPKNIGKKNE